MSGLLGSCAEPLEALSALDALLAMDVCRGLVLMAVAPSLEDLSHARRYLLGPVRSR